MAWKYWQTWPGFDGSRSFVLENGGQLIAHAAVLPLCISRDGTTHQLLQLLDWAAAPEHVGAGVTLLKNLAARCAGMVNVRGSDATQRILRPLGYRSLGSTMRYARRLPHDSERASQPTDPSYSVKRYSSNFDGAAAHPLALVSSSDVEIVPLRSLELMQALCRCPSAAMSYFELWSASRLVGCFLLCQTPGQQRLVDAWAQSLPAWRALLCAAKAEAAADPNARELVCQTNDPTQQSALLTAGFSEAGEDRLHVLCDERLVPRGARLRHQLVDSDLAYLHHGQPESWSDEAAARDGE